jgi:endo-alpha-1,4-polygalactosaminidase (GH114 family)
MGSKSSLKGRKDGYEGYYDVRFWAQGYLDLLKILENKTYLIHFTDEGTEGTQIIMYYKEQEFEP